MKVNITIKDQSNPPKPVQLESLGNGAVRLTVGGQSYTLDGRKFGEALSQCQRGDAE